VDYKHSVATIVKHKTRHTTNEDRIVPLLPPAIRLLKVVKGRGSYFTVAPGSRDTLFRKARDALLIKGLTFRDARAEILTRLARKVDVMTLSRISGHKDLNVLLRTYYREDAASIAARVAASFRAVPGSGAASIPGQLAQTIA
jgi:integrase